MADDLLNVSEVFGPTFQGEGPGAGQPAIFVRLWGCNLDCSWCDTPYTWDTTGKLGVVYDRADECRQGTVAQVVAEVDDLAAACTMRPMVVITGGEPMVQERAVVQLAAALYAAGYRVEVETNGTRPVPDEWRRGPSWLSVNVSPKLGHASTRQPDRRRVAEWAHLPRATVKVVCTTPGDLAEVAALVGDDVRPMVMPEGRTAERVLQVARELAPHVLARGWTMTLRHHVLLWGDTRGV